MSQPIHGLHWHRHKESPRQRRDRQIAKIKADPKPFIKRFMAHISVGDCWIWKGYRNSQGYGHSGFESAHRHSYRLFIGEIPHRFQVLHKCDNPSCVRPERLFLGTQKDNMQDAKAKGRTNRPQGERHAQAKLTTEQVRYIRSIKGKRKYKDIAAAFGVSYSLIEKVMRRVGWTHV